MEIRYGLGEAHRHRGYDRSRRAGIGTGVKAVRVSGIRKKYHHLAETMKPDAKRTGIRFLCDHLKISLDDCYAFGDSTNDLAMLDYVPYSVAMGNSDAIVKERCAYITDDVEHDGIYNAMKHFGLI